MNVSDTGKPLHTIITRISNVHKNDIKDYTSGHLNEAHLSKCALNPGHKTWDSSKLPKIELPITNSLVKKTRKSQQKNSKLNYMKDSVVNFTLGTSGTLISPRKQNIKPPEIYENETSTSTKVFIEELPSRIFTCRFPPRGIAFTKKEQLTQMNEFENTVIKSQADIDRQVLSGYATVVQHEYNLQNKLKKLKPYQGPNFLKLQSYANVFSDLISEASIFGHLLGIIKVEYDNYLSWLLDTHTVRVPVLQEQIETLEENDSCNSNCIETEMDAVKSLEKEAENCLLENASLRNYLKNELKDLEHPVLSDSPYQIKETTIHTPSDTIETLRRIIWEKLDEIQNVRDEMTQNYIPISDYIDLDQCCKETEIQIQKLVSEKEFFENNIKNLENELEEYIKNADTTEEDAKRVWKRIDAIKSIISPRGTMHIEDIESDNDNYGSEEKWNFYIS